MTSFLRLKFFTAGCELGLLGTIDASDAAGFRDYCVDMRRSVVPGFRLLMLFAVQLCIFAWLLLLYEGN